ncbi:RAB GDP/GTP exchange factor [Entamoeba marina]
MKSVDDGRNKRWIPIVSAPEEYNLTDPLEQLTSVFCKQHHSNYFPVNDLKVTDVFETNTYFKCLLNDDLGIEAILLAIRYGLTLIVPLSHPPLSEEFLSTHLIRRVNGGTEFVTLNGIYGQIEPFGLSLYTDQMISYPRQVYPFLFKNFPFNFHALKHYSTNVVGGGASLIEADVLHTPLGLVPVLFVSQPLRFFGCGWACGSHQIINKVVPRPAVVDISSGNSNSNGSHVNASRKEKEEYEKKRLAGIFQEDRSLWKMSIVETKSTELEISVTTALDDETVKEYLSATKDQFPGLVKNKSLLTRIGIFQKVVNGVMKKLPVIPQLIDTDTVRKVLESYLADLLYDFLWPPICYEGKELQSTELCDDVRLDEIIRKHQFIRPKHLDVGFFDNDTNDGISQVVGIFRMVNDVKSPASKLIILGNTFKTLQALAFSLLPKGDSVTADVLLPSFIYVVIRANVPHLASTLAYLSAFAERGDVNGEDSYYITNLFGALEFLKGIDSGKLTIDDKIYNDCLSKCDDSILQIDNGKEFGITCFERVVDIEKLSVFDKRKLFEEHKKLLAKNNELKEKLNVLLKES